MLGDGRPGCAAPGYVLLWVQQDVRTECNFALEYAVAAANAAKLPVLAAYGLSASYPGATERSLRFLLEGLVEYRLRLRYERGIRLVCLEEAPDEGAAVVVAETLHAGARLPVADVTCRAAGSVRKAPRRAVVLKAGLASVA